MGYGELNSEDSRSIAYDQVNGVVEDRSETKQRSLLAGGALPAAKHRCEQSSACSLHRFGAAARANQNKYPVEIDPSLMVDLKELSLM